MEKTEILRQYFGYASFRKGQEALIDSILEGRDTLGIMPTGAGKSLCFQVPALMLEGVTLVISPLISLMKDQVSALCQAGIRAAYLNSSLTYPQYRKALANACAGVYKIIYVAPERLLTEEFLAFSHRVRIALVTVDEAHCISQWGQDFRPSYLKVPEFVAQLDERPVLAAFTATATEEVKRDIAAMLSLRDPFTITTGFNRDNLYFEVDKPPDKMAALLRYLRDNPGKSGIVYCTTRKTVEEVCQKLRTAGFPATRYHAGLSPEERRDNQEDFLYDRAPLMVATNAFGMGIDKSNVAFVLHYNMPGSMEAYYQEAGRAGRDGQPAQCILYYSGQDVATNRFLIEHGEGAPDADEETTARLREQDKERLKQMTFYCHTADCLREYILRYFGETPENYCGNCGNCSRNFEEADVTREAQLLVEGIARTGQRFGAKMVLDILRGSGNARILSGGFDKLPVYGKLAGVGEKRLRAILQFLELRGFVESTGDEYPVLRLRETAEDLMREDAALTMKIAREEAPAPARKSREPVPANPGLFDALRALRAKLAAAQSVPAYVVFSDATLRDMCARLPADADEMLEVSGVGQAKFAKYGEEFLGAIRDYTDKNGIPF
ncbi:MAG: DNA helicase RecQ [Oscillospiraceae bacterium]|nr:DNA helicase RecQ [Oscillospiraceae bacterium]